MITNKPYAIGWMLKDSLFTMDYVEDDTLYAILGVNISNEAVDVEIVNHDLILRDDNIPLRLGWYAERVKEVIEYIKIALTHDRVDIEKMAIHDKDKFGYVLGRVRYSFNLTLPQSWVIALDNLWKNMAKVGIAIEYHGDILPRDDDIGSVIVSSHLETGYTIISSTKQPVSARLNQIEKQHGDVELIYDYTSSQIKEDKMRIKGAFSLWEVERWMSPGRDFYDFGDINILPLLQRWTSETSSIAHDESEETA